MNIILFLSALIVFLILWLTSTSLVVNGKTTLLAFLIKSILYWLSIFLSFIIGFYIASH